MKQNVEGLESLKRRVSGLAKNAGGHREYSAEIKEEILALVDRHVSAGGSRVEIARELGVHSSTMAFWVNPSKSKKRSKHIRAVAVLESSPLREPRDTTAVFSCGVARVEGLTLLQVAELLKSLSC